MILIIPEEYLSATADLLWSLQAELRDLRHAAQDLKTRIRTGEAGDLTVASRSFAGADALVKTCHEVETTFVELRNKQTGIVQNGYALDLAEARREVARRLDCLQAADAEGGVSGPD